MADGLEQRLLVLLKKRGDDDRWIYWQRHKRDEFIDRVAFDVVPRFKTSGLSGDEWRTSIRLRFFCKNVMVFETGFGTLEAAAAYLPWGLKVYNELADEEQFKKIDEAADQYKDGKFCFQYGCTKEATAIYRVITEYDMQGNQLKDEGFHELRRAFCDEHSCRGDCGMEDADRNYEKLSRADDEPKSEPDHPFGDPKSLE